MYNLALPVILLKFMFMGHVNNLMPLIQVSNIIYLDSPAGVGLSYSKNSSNYVTGDLQTASDTHVFLLKVIPL